MAETRWIGGSPFAEKKPIKKIEVNESMYTR